MDYGIGIAGIAISAGAVAITAIKVRANGNVKTNTCSLHSGIEATLNFLKEGQKRIEEKLDRVIGGE